MRVAIVSYNFSESSIVLAKYLSERVSQVDYYYITSWKEKNTWCFDFEEARRTLGVVKLKAAGINPLFSYLPKSINVSLLRLAGHSEKWRMVNEVLIKYMCRTLNALNYDVINIVGQSDYLIDFHKNLKSKIVHTLHEVASHYKEQVLGMALIDYLFRNNRTIIVHSKESYSRIIKYKECTPVNVNLIPFGLFEGYRQFKEINISAFGAGEDILLFYGIIRPYKGLDVLIEAVKQLNGQLPNLKVVIAGHGVSEDLSKINGDDRFLVINKILTNSEVVSLNKRCKVVVCPYKSASQSGIVMTSFCFGKPIIASNLPAFSDVISHEENGLLVTPNSVSDLSNAIYRIFTDSTLLRKLESGASSFSTNPNYNWNDITNKTLDVYRK